MLERELLSTRESLQATIEELQTSNEEFKSANEELQSTNEELQSANEEMETSKEELQSLNEELTTVNAEAEAKALELSRANDDILNLFNSTQIATLFLDNHLRIKRYAEPVRRIFRLIPSDLGRPLSDLANQLEYPSLLQDCRAVLQSLTPKTAEVRTRDGHWFLMRIMPYRTAENAVDGVVATFVDIQPVKSAEVSSCRLKTVFEGNPDPLILIDLRGAILELNPKARDLLGPFPDPLVPFKFEACLDAGSLKPFRSAFKKTLRTQSVSELHLSLISQRGMLLSTSIRFLPLQNGTPSGQSVCLVLHSISAPAYGPKKDQ
jgi:two-component system CheB/CheR fusion protein